MPELSNYTTLSGSIRVFDASLSKTQFEEIWDRIEERVNSDLMPEYAVIDNELDRNSSNPVENKVIKSYIDRLYRLFPTVQKTGTNISIFDGGADLPLENLIFEFGPVQSGSGDPSPVNGRPFETISSLPSIQFTSVPADGEAPPAFGVITFDFNEIDSNGLYAGRVDFNAGQVWPCRYYSSYNGEVLTGPWASSIDVYSEEGEPTIGASVIDLGSYIEPRALSSNKYLEELGTILGGNTYRILQPTEENPTPCRYFSVIYRADPDLYVVQAVGLTTEQRQALIDLLDD